MKICIAPALLICFLCLLPATAQSAEEGMPPAAPQEKSFSQSVSDGYHSLKDSVTHMFGGYSGNEEDDSRAYMEQYRKDLSEYHETLRKARADYRRARLDDQKAYLEHHDVLPMREDLDSDSGPLH